MSIFKKQSKQPPYPISQYEPVLCNDVGAGKLTACFRERSTNQLHEIVVIHNYKDLAEFGKQYGVRVEDMRTVY